VRLDCVVVMLFDELRQQKMWTWPLQHSFLTDIGHLAHVHSRPSQPQVHPTLTIDADAVAFIDRMLFSLLA
jgi:hypothetical protein